jgi:hypothetical protein
VAFAFHCSGSFQVPQPNTSSGSVSGGHVRALAAARALIFGVSIARVSIGMAGNVHLLRLA